jgi:hypothetical protein
LTNLNSKEALAKWLEDKPREWAQIISIRSALRVVPFIGEIFEPNNIRLDDRRKYVSILFFSSFIPWIYNANSNNLATKSICRDISRVVYSNFSDTRFMMEVSAAANMCAAFSYSARAIYAADFAFVAADAVSSGIDAARAARIGGSHNQASPDSTEKGIWNAINSDLKALEVDGVPPSVLANKKLWPRKEPIWFDIEFTKMARMLLDDALDWEFWIHWYDARVNGGFVPSIAMDGEYRVAENILTKNETWWGLPIEANRDLSQWYAEQRIRRSESERGSIVLTAEEQIIIPSLRVASLEPKWLGGKLEAGNQWAEKDINSPTLSAAVAALHNSLSLFSSDIEQESNIDRRFKEMIYRLLLSLSEGPPETDAALFGVAPYGASLTAYVETASNEWNATLAAQLIALASQFDRTMDKFPTWRDFKSNPGIIELTVDQISGVLNLTDTLSSELETELAREFIGGSTAKSLHTMKDQLLQAGASHAYGNSTSLEEQLRARDALESINNWG